MPTLPQLPLVKIYPLWQAEQVLCDKGGRAFFQSVISIGYDAYEKEPEGLFSFSRPKIRLNVNDVSLPQLEGAATRKDIQDLVNFIPQVTGPLLIHCHAGVSRSTAAMLIFYATKLGPKRYKDAIDLWYDHERRGEPNKLMVAYADHVLGCEGKLFGSFLETTEYDKYPEIRELYDRIKSP